MLDWLIMLRMFACYRFVTLIVLATLLLNGCANLAPQTESSAAGTIENQLMAEIAMQRGAYQVAAEQYLQLAQQSKDPEYARRATEFAFQYGFDATALASAERWAELRPADQAAHYYLGRLYVRRNSLDDAWESLQLALGPAAERSSESYMKLSTELAENGHASRALEIYQRFNNEYPDVAGITGALAVLAAESGDLELAVDAARETIAIAPDWVGMRVWLARFLLAQGESYSAYEQMAFALEMKPGIELELEFIGLIASAEEPAEALERLDRLQSRFPGSPDLQRTRALILLQAGEPQLARLEFTELLANAFFVNECFWHLGQFALQEGSYRQAIRYFSRINSGGWLVPSRVASSQAYLALGELEMALAVQREFAADYPKYAFETFVPRAEILYAIGRQTDALAAVEAARQYQPWNAELYMYEGGLHEQSGDLAAAIKSFEQAVKYAPDDATALNALGYTLTVTTRRYKDAYGYISRALEFEPENPAIMDSMGWVLYQQGKLAEAREWLERAYAELSDPEVAAHLGEVLWVQGDQDGAQQIWQDALQENPDSAVLNETIKRMME